MAKAKNRPAPTPSEVYGPHLPPGAMMQNGRLVPIPPKPNDPVECDRMAAKPIDLAMLAVPGWCNRGGGVGFKVNGMAVVRRR
jgi:hypothetical protein